MFDISRILDPIHSHIALFFSILHRGSKGHHSGANQPRIDHSLDGGAGSKSQRRTRRSRIQERRNASSAAFSASQLDRATGGAVRDREYYYESSSDDDSCCILMAENTLFKVHKLVLCRDGSAFGRKLWFQHSGTSLGSSDAKPLVLRTSAEKFRDLLWVLHALPPDFYHNPEDTFDDSYTDNYIDFRLLSLDRLLNIAEMAHKFSFPSFESWAIHQICRILRCSPRLGKAGTSSTASSATLISTSPGNKPEIDNEEPLASLDETDAIYARLLSIALTSDHSSLLHYLVQKLVTKVLWYNQIPGVSLVRMLERNRHHPALATLLGVVYYRILIDMPQVWDTNLDGYRCMESSQPIFEPTINVERRMQFLAAHHKLTQKWKDICSSPPPLPSSTTSTTSSGRRPLRPHTGCNDAWRCLWRTACYQAQERDRSTVKSISGDEFTELKANSRIHAHGEGRRSSSADVLSLLKNTMLQLRKLTASTSSICLDCSLEGLEAVDLLRDQLIEGLIHMFVYEH
ncbi:hypothetical protein D9757_007893 [Collybiopsis confluens]|uniref:BTB domain-containing protein n=1 Tax=Collybiopsis confluens TaxID=2823264 RepID=A0A8H5M597_9AGAR|nr:hypothetical protein D9757_007893 [Collybiopsis confluens]